MKKPGSGSASRRHAAWWFGLSFVAFVLALLSKTTTIMLPVTLLCCAAWQRGRITRRDLLHTTPYFVLALAFGLMSIWFQKNQALAGETILQTSFGERLITAGRDFWFYVGKAVWPANLSVFYSRWRTDVPALQAGIPALLMGVIFVLSWRFRRSWGRHALFGMGCFAILLFPALGFFDAQCFTKFQVSDHLQYLPLIALVSLAAAVIAALFNTRIFQGVAIALIVALSILAFKRASSFFATEEGLMRDTLAKNPAAWAADNDLGVVLVKKGKFAEATDHFKASLQSNPNNPDAHSNLGKMFALQGRLDEACVQHRAAIALRPDNPLLHENLAMTLEQLGKDQEAITQLNIALQFTPKIETRLNLAGLHYKTRDFHRAVAQYHRALSLDTDNVKGLNNLGWLLATCSDDTVRNGAEAIELAERACRITEFKQSFVISTLAAAYAEGGRFPEAVTTAETALRLQDTAGETQFAAINRQLLEFYRAGKPWHEGPISN